MICMIKFSWMGSRSHYREVREQTETAAKVETHDWRRKSMSLADDQQRGAEMEEEEDDDGAHVKESIQSHKGGKPQRFDGFVRFDVCLSV